MNAIPRALTRIRAWPRPTKRLIMVVADAVTIVLALWLAFALKFDSLTHGLERSPWLYIGTASASVTIFWLLGLYRSIVRYIAPQTMLAVLAGANGSASVLYLLGKWVALHPVPISLAAIYAMLALTWVAGSRYFARWLLLPRGAIHDVVAIFGAGEAGARLARALHGGRGVAVAAFLDDKRSLHGSIIDGIRVHSADRVGELIASVGISRILLAIPSASRKRRSEIIRRLEVHDVRVQTIPNLAEIASGRARVDEIREIEVEDLLGRDPVPPNSKLLDACIRGKSVLVTGAGGSIGSELCRQILRLGPRRLVLFERSELALYHIERELREVIADEAIDVDLVPLLGNAHNKHRVRDVLEVYGVQTLYHAAAYKHVPIVEQNVIDGIHNNVVSTWYVAEAALECQLETFVLISTDKAVNPTNVMGATKRLAEMVLQGLQRRSRGTKFCMVRFGNVLESSGSVVPLFRDQIRRGGPVTVTHPDVIRFFMTIPEAAQLVLQAGSMAEGGDVFLLDMGKPVRIHDLARRMISLSGLAVRDEQHPDGDIEIEFTGLRPAEKLYEELLIGDNVTGTAHPRIMRALEHSLGWDELQELLQELMGAMERFDVRLARDLLLRAVGEYQPASDVVDHVWCRREAARALSGKVTRLASARQIVRREPLSAQDLNH